MSFQPPPAQKKSGSCFLYGCLIAIVILAIVIGFIFFMLRRGVTWIVDEFTTTTPIAVPTVMVDGAVVSGASSRFRAFLEQVEGKQVPTPLSLSAQELNMLVATEPSLAPLRGKIFFEFTGDEAALTFNFPLAAATEVFPGLNWLGADIASRFVNGTARGVFSLSGDEVGIDLRKLTLNGKDVDESGLAQFNSAARQSRVIKSDKPEVKEFLATVGEARIQNGTLIIRGPAEKGATGQEK
jgi:hypothetical protein